MKITKGGENYTGDIIVPAKKINYKFSEKSYFFNDTEFIKRTQLYNIWLWKKFVEQFRIYGVDDNRWHDVKDGWRSEYWGKMMRGACLVAAYSKDDTLYEILTSSVKDLLSTADSNGRITTYSREYEFNGWDLWGRKYVLLGLQYYLDICKDETLSKEIVEAMCRQADRIIERVGKEEGKTPIGKTSSFWGALNSSSLLEPIVRLYNITENQKYLDFADYIVSEGGADGFNIFEAAYRDESAPYQYKYVKAYEMMSCFEGLVEYSRTTGNARYRQAAINFGYKLLETDVTIIGCLGCTHELLDNSKKFQTRDVNETHMQETCVTVTWMKLCSQLLRLTGDSVFAEAMEQSFCNAYLGALNTHEVVRPMFKKSTDPDDKRLYPYYSMLTFDSYSPLTADVRGRAVGGPCVFFDDKTYYGCCACIGSAGMGLMAKISVMEEKDCMSLQYYIGGRVSFKSSNGYEGELNIITDYPYEGDVFISVEKWDSMLGGLKLRIPSWSRKTSLTLNGEDVSVDGDYVTLNVSEGSLVCLALDMRVREILPPCPDGPRADEYAAYAYGAVLLAKDARIGDNFEEPINALADKEGYASFEYAEKSYDEIRDARLYIEITQRDGKHVRLVDYSSAGKTLDQNSKCAVWLIK